MTRALVPVPRKPSAARRALCDVFSIFSILAAGMALVAVVLATCAPTPAPAREPAQFSTHCEPLGDTGATICKTRFPGLVVCYSVVGGMDVPAVSCQ